MIDAAVRLPADHFSTTEMNVGNELFELFNTVREKVNIDEHLKHLGRYCTTEMLLQSGEQSVHLVIEHGLVIQVVQGPLNMRAWQFALRAKTQAWNEFWKPVPGVGFNDIFAMSRYGHLSIDGDIGPLLENLRYIKEVLAMPRNIQSMAQVNSAAAGVRA